ncbi:gem nuclear organelle associated protein rigor mortis [Haematobia irritans]|uniref:gem nuclear organelle associated protein rigor mortis n=1 Tax=Haematobia irritans TaxID=7368 RepID=UPI003F4F53F5
MTRFPLVAQWNLSRCCVCSPDGGILYVGSRSINYIGPMPDNGTAPEIKLFHNKSIPMSIDIDPHWGENSREGGVGINDDTTTKLFVVLSQDNSVQIWDFNKGCALQGHKAHVACMRYMEGNGPSPQNAGDVFISYMINRNVLSVDNQDIVVYCVASNSFCRRPMFISPRNHQLTAMKCSPYHENYFAVGTSRGLVLLCDLQKMVTIYTLRGHDAAITSLAWNRVLAADLCQPSLDKGGEVKVEKARKKPVKLARTDTTIIDTDDIFDIYDYDYLDNEFGATPQTKMDPISEFVGIEKSKESSGTAAEFDFAEACQSLKEEINALREDQGEHMSSEHVSVSLDDCKNSNIKDDTSSYDSASDNEEENARSGRSEGSIVRLVCGTPSSEESLIVDGLDRQQQLVCQADVHASHVAEIQTEPSVADEDVKCLSPEDILGDILLASTGMDGSLYVWNTSSGAVCDHHKIRGSHIGKNKKNVNIEIFWLNSISFITSNRSGELQVWSLTSPTTNTQHSSVSTMPQLKQYKFKECNKKRTKQKSIVAFAVCPKRQMLWCLSSNREIFLEDLASNRTILKYGCVSTNISALRECPEDMNKIALGFSDRRIGVIDISKLSPSLIHIDNFVQRIESPVTSLVWSPDCKKLAYGTVEGRIGIINIEGGHKQQPLALNSVCGKTIYSINWQERYIFVVCNERIAVYEDNPNNKDAYIIPDITCVSAISLRNSYLFVGTQNGRLRLYSRKAGEKSQYFQYELKIELELSSRYITEISWSPIATNKFAVVSNANNVNILKFKDETGTLEMLHKFDIKSTKAANSCAKWSNRNDNLLLTCGFDGAIRVWDLSAEISSERFIKLYHCPMKCGLFLPTDEDVLLCAGTSTSLELIDMRLEQSDENLAKPKRSNNRTLDNVQWATKASTRHDGKPGQGPKKSNKGMELNPSCCLEQKNCPEQSSVGTCEDVSNMLEKLELTKDDKASANSSSIYMKIPTTLLYLTTKELNKDAVDVMYNILCLTVCEKTTENKSLCAKLFGSKSEATQLLTDELKNHQNSESKGISNILMPQLNGSIKDEILKCVQAKQLCEWHVSIAPSISYGFWQKCCQAYADQLQEQGCTLQSVVYMLAIHMEREAIEILMQKNYFKEALLLSRIYLQPDDPLNNNIAEQWITHLYNNGHLTGAALLCLLSQQYNRAYDCLVKIRNTGADIERVIRLLKKSDN